MRRRPHEEGKEEVELAKIEVNDYGGSPFCEHNFPCPVCAERHAVRDMQTGMFHPCWRCTKAGWELRKLGRFRRAMNNLIGNQKATWVVSEDENKLFEKVKVKYDE